MTRRRFWGAAQQQAMAGVQVPVGLTIALAKGFIHWRQIDVRATLGSDSHIAATITIGEKHSPIIECESRRATIGSVYRDPQSPRRFKLKPVLERLLKA
jgi:hypothetical protein